jgi:hypothetical protein
MSDYFEATSFNHALKSLGMSSDEFLQRAQTAGVLLYFPLPEGAKLQPQNEAVYAEATTVSDIFNRTTYSTTAPLAGMEYFAPDCQLLTKAIQYPGVLFDHVTRLAKRSPAESRLTSYALIDAFRASGDMTHYDILIAAGRPMRLHVSSDASAAISIDQALIACVDLEKIADHIVFPVPPGEEAYGAFEPRKSTSQIICDLNTAFYQFVVRQPSTREHGRVKEEIKHWLESTWNKGNGHKTVTDEVIGEAVKVILGMRDADAKPEWVTDNTVKRHNKNTPTALMLLEELSIAFQERDVYSNKNLKLDYRSKGNFYADVINLGMPEQYTRLVSQVIR